MSPLSGHVEDYLRLRRALGFKLERAGQPAAAARRLPGGRRRADADQRAGDRLGPAARRARPTTGPQRLAVARGFARYLQTIDPATEVPPPGVFPSPPAPPHPLPVVTAGHMPASRWRPGAAPAAAGGDL